MTSSALWKLNLLILNGSSGRFNFVGLQNHVDVTAALKLIWRMLIVRKALRNLDGVLKKQRHHFADKDPSSQSYGFSSSHIWLWDLDHKEGWAPKNWCFWTVVLEKTPQSPLDLR